jgi:hypothetical protein
VIIVLDTNILVSGLISRTNPPGELIEAFKAGRFTLVTSKPQLLEFQRVLTYRRLQKYVRHEQSQTLIATIVSVAEIVDNLPSVEFSPDPDDNFIIATAIAGNADLLVSGDKSDLLILDKVEGIPIVTPRQALELLDED